jgi:hypothetical protein
MTQSKPDRDPVPISLSRERLLERCPWRQDCNSKISRALCRLQGASQKEQSPDKNESMGPQRLARGCQSPHIIYSVFLPSRALTSENVLYVLAAISCDTIGFAHSSSTSSFPTSAQRASSTSSSLTNFGHDLFTLCQMLDDKDIRKI